MEPDSPSHNLAVVERRWPELYRALVELNAPERALFVAAAEQPTLLLDGIHLSSCFDSKGEARLQASVVPESAAAVWVYGVATGDLQRELLQRLWLQQLNVVILNLELFRSCLRYFDHSDWLADERVRLGVATAVADIRVPFCVVPACLKLSDLEAARVRDLIVLELDTSHINARVRNNPQFQRQIEENVALVQGDGDVESLFCSYGDRLCYVAAAGPSLSEHYQRLREREPGTYLVAVDAALKPLLLNGIVPDLVVTIDGMREHILKLFDVDLAPLAKIPLVYFPIVHRDVLERWPGPRYAAYSNSPLYEALMLTAARGQLYASGTVLHAAVDLAVKMGSRQLCLLGADFAFPGNRSHVASAVFCQTVEQSGYQEWLVDGHGQRVLTSKNLRGYMRDLERYIAQHPQVSFINGSRSGALIAGTHYLDSLSGDGHDAK
jgi:hypothetical protein